MSDEGFTEERPVDPDRLESRVGELPIVFRGVDQAAAEHLIRRSAAEIRRLRRELERAAVAPRADPAEIDEAMLTARLGEEAAMVLSAAREAAAQVRTKAEDNVARMIREAQDEIDELRAKTERERALILSRASDEAEGIIGTAQRVQNEAVHRADNELATARAQSEEILRITGDHRERVLEELGQIHGRLVGDIRTLDKQRTQMLDDLKVAQGRLGRTLGDLDKSQTLPSPLALPPPPKIPDDSAAKLTPQPARTPDKIVPPEGLTRPAAEAAPAAAETAEEVAGGGDDGDVDPGDAGDVGVEIPPAPDGSAPGGAMVDPPAVPPADETLFDTDVVPPADPPVAPKASSAAPPTDPPAAPKASSVDPGIDLRESGPVTGRASEPDASPATAGALALHHADLGLPSTRDDAGQAGRRSRRRRHERADGPLPAGDVSQFRIDVGGEQESVRLLSTPAEHDPGPNTGPIAPVIELRSDAEPTTITDEADRVSAAPDPVDPGPPLLGPDDLAAGFTGGGPLDPRPGEYVVDLGEGGVAEAAEELDAPFAVDAAEVLDAPSRVEAAEVLDTPSRVEAAEVLDIPSRAEAAEVLAVDGDPDDDADRATTLFAQLRASREAQVDEARRVLADDPAAERSAEPTPEPEPEPDAVDGLFTGRDVVVHDQGAALVKQIKRVLGDQQNVLLDELRQAEGTPDVRTLIGSPAHAIANEAYPFLSRAAEGGAELIGTALPIAVDDLAAGFADELATPLEARLGRALSEAGSDAGRRLRAVFREFRSERLPALAEAFVSAAVARGVFTAIHPDGAVVWRCHPDQGCAEGADNELAGSLRRGEPFPTGHVEAPAYVGCRCLVVPEQLTT